MSKKTHSPGTADEDPMIIANRREYGVKEVAAKGQRTAEAVASDPPGKAEKVATSTIELPAREEASSAIKGDLTGALLLEGFSTKAVVEFRNQILTAFGNPSNPGQRMLIENAVASHIMILQMHQRALKTDDPNAFEVYSRAAARLTAEFRRTLIVIAEFPMLGKSRESKVSVSGRCIKSAARVAAGRLNRKLPGPLTDAGRRRLRDAALRDQPWRCSTGPRTENGKAAVALNGRKRMRGKTSARERRAIVAEASSLISQMAILRAQVSAQIAGGRV